MSVYQDNGYANRKEYLDSLAGEYGLTPQEVYLIASMMGPSEDFDGLISALEDWEDTAKRTPPRKNAKGAKKRNLPER